MGGGWAWGWGVERGWVERGWVGRGAWVGGALWVVRVPFQPLFQQPLRMPTRADFSPESMLRPQYCFTSTHIRA